MLIIYQTPHQLDITAHRETHLKDLEAYAAETTGDRWTAGPLTTDCRPDPLNRANLVWTLYPTQPTTPRYTVRYKSGLVCGADGPLCDLVGNPDITHVQPRTVTPRNSRHVVIFSDSRYSANLEFTGHPERRFVLRFCGDYIGVYQTADKARTAQREHNSMRLAAMGVTEP